jgi:hypothetical protein
MNPAVGTNSVEITKSIAETRYDSLVFEVRRRLARVVVQRPHALVEVERYRDTLHYDRVWVRSTGGAGSVPTR